MIIHMFVTHLVYLTTCNFDGHHWVTFMLTWLTSRIGRIVWFYPLILLSSCFNRLAKTDVVVIDEISMVSSATLHQINKIMQYVKGSNVVMGGCQRIFCGDFLQLPPIPNELSDDVGEYAILSPQFAHYVPHKIHLTEVISLSVFQFLNHVACFLILQRVIVTCCVAV